MQYEIPPTTTALNLCGIFRIHRAPNCDDIYLGEKLVGSIYELPEYQSSAMYSLKYEFMPFNLDHVFTARDSYEEVWLDILTELANDSDLAVEFTIQVTKYRHSKKETATETTPVTESELF